MASEAEDAPAPRAPWCGWPIYGLAVMVLPPVFYWRLWAKGVPTRWRFVGGWWLVIWMTIALSVGYSAAHLPPGS